VADVAAATRLMFDRLTVRTPAEPGGAHAVNA
jgi:hypothetical protein